MKKRNFSIIIGLILIVLGIGTIVVSVLIGFRYSNFLEIINGDFALSFYDVEDIDKTFDQQFSNIEIDCDISNITIHNSDSFRIEVKNAIKSSMNIASDDTSLKITQDKQKNKFLFNFFGLIRNPQTEIDLYIPEDIIFETFKVSTQIGNIRINKLYSKYTELSPTVGDLEIDYINTQKMLSTIDVGTIEIKSGSISNSNISVDVGDININSNLMDNNEFDIDVGDLTLNVKGDKNTFFINSNTDVGDSYINNYKNSGYGYEDAQNHIIASCDFGEININF